ncbi:MULTISPECIES: DMT family transporter [Rhodobacterales]|uniref:DMT family transporter n=1 Tax=Roseobacter sp. N2S TaxID=2663844 RepID=UPI00285E8486|nr:MULTISPECIES: DMT family transporter [Rhodobacterales]MDR6265178.1 drug/metabolite transporter (DMT)-like permease [Roseobacter sp. N2S]
MQLFLLTTLTMIAFAANSVLNRMGLAGDLIDPGSFALIRLGAGAAVLLGLVALRRSGLSQFFAPARGGAVLGLAAYMLGFSFAYVALDAGTGALILFGGVQITMFAGAVLGGKSPKAMQWLGAAIAFAGLIYLLAPSATAPDLVSAGLMGIAAVGWGVYSLIGQKTADPLGATAANFVLALPFGLLALGVVPAVQLTGAGVGLAVLSGAVTSALGYALWYWVLPRLATATAAVAQLSVPIIAAGAGALLLAEPLTLEFAIAAALVLGGIAVSLLAANRR